MVKRIKSLETSMSKSRKECYNQVINNIVQSMQDSYFGIIVFAHKKTEN